ncbi:type 1 glutamine amidotransferase domain-containing protein [Actinospica durhamensis]|uniref:Type 1 glutamine amidotransferase domain-containing protein n=1 Tax=Actinospica durhamensis TaxID=1508375 RepID=A0A941IU74_9ACTN|nr:type 1 glutamine amidotransferase domain-containing protein [Actinospica durhamensis]MBR7837043.1 type 1 glutamine amidotransferase domain-containing protein [Actinospica durhamensis]
MAEILFMMTGSDHWTLKDGTRRPSGFWAEEAVTPLEAFRAAGHRVTVATPGGVVPPADPASLEPGANGGDEGAARMRKAVGQSPEFASPVALGDVDPARYAAVYVPGGHGPMEDLAVDPDAGRVLTGALDAGMPIGIVCHGPAALLTATREDGTNAFAGFGITCFTDKEEELAGTAAAAPWLLETRLKQVGLQVEDGAPFRPHTARDRNLHTGQNPSSSAPLAAELISVLQ